MEAGTGPDHQEQGRSELQQNHRGALAPLSQLSQLSPLSPLAQLSALSEKVMSKLRKISYKEGENCPRTEVTP